MTRARIRLVSLATVIVALAFAGAAIAKATGLIYATHAGVTCAFGTGPQGRGVACTRTSKTGYGVTLTDSKVIVWKNGVKVFERSNP